MVGVRVMVGIQVRIGGRVSSPGHTHEQEALDRVALRCGERELLVRGRVRVRARAAPPNPPG